MPPRGRKSALEELIRTGLVADGELLRYKSKQGQLLAVGRAREGGIEVEGANKLLGYTAFEDVAGSRYHRPAEHTHTSTSRTLQGLQLLAAGDGGGGGGGGGRGRQAQQQPEEPAFELLEDENDDLCHICGLGGDLVCCESCPAVYHATCIGLPEAPAGDFFCPNCRCTVCLAGGTEGVMPTGCQWVSCSRFAGTDALQQLSRPHIGPPGSGSGAGAASSDVKAEAAAEASAEPSGSGEAMQLDAGECGTGGAVPAAAGEAAAEKAAGAADFSRLIEAATSECPPADGPPAEAAEAAVAAAAVAAAAPGGAAVHCPVTRRWGHLRCFPPEFANQLRQGTNVACISSQAAVLASTRLAAVCTAGLLPLGSIAEGARAGSGSGGAAAEGGGVDARALLPVSLLVVRGAAAAAPGDCRGHAPAYTPQQREQLQTALSAALVVLHSCYEAIPDSRTGADLLPWLLRGAVLAGGEADFSGMHAALLYVGPAVAAVALFRSFGEVAELPVLAVRPELQHRNGLGRLLLAAVEQLLLQAGTQWLFTPAFTPSGLPYLPHPPLAAGSEPPAAEPPALLQGKWGYSLAPAQQSLAASWHPLVRLPGVLLACKQLMAESVLPPPLLPQRLQWSGAVEDPRPLLRNGMLASVASAPGVAAAANAAAAAAAANKAAAAAAAKGKQLFGRPPKAPVPVPAPTAAAAAAGGVTKQEEQQQQPMQAAGQAQQAQASQQQHPMQQQQHMMARLYQQQMLAQQAAAAQHVQQHAQQMVLQQPGGEQQQLLALYQQQQQQQMAYLQQLSQQQPEAYAQLMQQQQMALQQQQQQAGAFTQQQHGGAPGYPGMPQHAQQQPHTSD